MSEPAAKQTSATGAAIKNNASPRLHRENDSRSVLNDLSQDVQKDSKPMGLGVFLILLSIAILLDLLDLLDLTGIGAIIVVVISLLLGAAFFFAFYIFDPETKLSSTKSLVKKVVGYVVELIPAIGILPINSLLVIYVYIISQPKFKKAINEVSGATETGKKLIGVAEKLKKIA